MRLKPEIYVYIPLSALKASGGMAVSPGTQGMISYWAVLSAQFRSLLQYRAAALAGLGTQVFWGLIRVMIFQAFFRSTTVEQPMELGDVLTYVWLGQAFLALLPWQDNAVRSLIRTGGVGYELLRPVDLYGFWYCRSLAFRTAPTLLRAVPLIAFAGVFMGMDAPASWAAAGAFAASMIGAILLSSAITTLFSITMMWTISGDGVFALAPGIVGLLSGMLVPIPLFPDWAQTVLNILPFRGLVDTPYRFYLGHIPVGDLPLLLAHQMVWVVAIVLIGRWMLSRGLRRLVIQGG